MNIKKIFKIKKAGLRIVRILTGRPGVYGRIGRKNQFTKGTYIPEGAKIGNYNYFGPYCMINNAIIGNYCSIGPGVKMGQGIHSMDYITTFQDISEDLIGHSLNQEPAILGSDVWCGANVVVMQGVKIGDGAVIGANAVVTHDIPDYGIAVGVPARVIKYRFKPEEIGLIKSSNWFDFDIEEAKIKITLLQNKLNLNGRKV